MTDVTDRLIAAVKGYVARAFTGENPAWKALEERVAALELREKALAYKGTWQRATSASYARHNLCTFDGSLWIALRDAPGVPGDDDSWQLVCKRGRDGRDAR